jgi:serine/threonine protein kinase
MMTATGLARSPLHPYNSTQLSQEAAQMIDNLKQLHLSYFGETPIAERIYKNNKTKPGSLSEAAKSFISSCLQPLSDDRPTIESLLEHEFFEGFDN